MGISPSTTHCTVHCVQSSCEIGLCYAHQFMQVAYWSAFLLYPKISIDCGQHFAFQNPGRWKKTFCLVFPKGKRGMGLMDKVFYLQSLLVSLTCSKERFVGYCWSGYFCSSGKLGLEATSPSVLRVSLSFTLHGCIPIIDAWYLQKCCNAVA